MNNLQSVMSTLESKGNEKTRTIYGRHGNVGPMFGVSNADLKLVAKTIKGDQDLAYDLYATGNLDAMYLAGIVASGTKMSRELLQEWAEGAKSMPMITDYPVAWVTVEHPAAANIAYEWIASDQLHISTAGWCTYAGLLAVTPDEHLNLTEIESLLTHAENQIATSADRVRLKMNGFVIAVGTYVAPLLPRAKTAARNIGTVSADMGETSCKIRQATEYIDKVESSGKVGQKRKTIRC